MTARHAPPVRDHRELSAEAVAIVRRRFNSARLTPYFKAEPEEMAAVFAEIDRLNAALSTANPPTPAVEVGMRQENDVLRGLLANSNAACPYCGLAASDWTKCAHGFPGCSRADDAALSTPEPRAEGWRTFQDRVATWVLACFGPEIAADKIERNHRFLEEALELVQSTGCTRSEAHQLVDYVYDRDVGDPDQEVGGVMNTLAALCGPNGLDLEAAAERELARVNQPAIMEKIKRKQAAKPKHSPLPASPQPQPGEE